MPAAQAINNDLETMVGTVGASSPELTKLYSSRLHARLKLTQPNVVGIPGLQAWALYLGTIRGELDHVASDPDSGYSGRIERATQHLQRLIVVDSDVASKWLTAYRQDEPACERLGAVHLLWHGVWAFKAGAAGERTDLITGLQLDNSTVDDATRGDSALTLTEWKRVTATLNATVAAEQAKKQLARYSVGTLAATELRRTCYAILVSEKHEVMPADQGLSNGKIVRFINIAVNPSVPSKS